MTGVILREEILGHEHGHTEERSRETQQEDGIYEPRDLRTNEAPTLLPWTFSL